MRSRPEHAWVCAIARKHWGRGVEEPVRALDELSEPAITHTSSLWVVGMPGQALLLKILPSSGFARPLAFYGVKATVLERCQAEGVPVAPPVRTLTGAPFALEDGMFIEAARYIPAAQAYTGRPGQREAVMEATFRLRETLDRAPVELARELEHMPMPMLVEEERLEVILQQVEEQLLPLAQRRTDAWGQRALLVLESLLLARPILLEAEAPAPLSTIHGDLHRFHFLFEAHGPARLHAIIDFDNLRAGPRLFDLAWLMDLVAWRAGQSPQPEQALAVVEAARERGLMEPQDAPRAMSLLIRYAAPILGDIAKDILVRNILDPVWIEYAEILDILRKVRIFTILRGPGSRGGSG